MATDRKQQKSKNAILTTITLTFRRCYCGQYCLFMNIAVVDLFRLTLRINCSFLHLLLKATVVLILL